MTAPTASPPRPGPSRLELRAPAKLNLFLHVTGRRADGYHLLETVFRFVDLCDRIVLVARDDGRIVRSGGLAGLAPEDDLAVKAALALKNASGFAGGADIAVSKVIPVGAGLGGGSSDAASVLMGLNRLWRLELPRERLMAIGLTLGADVPVFVFGRNAYATGIGERLEPVSLPPQWFVLAMPAVSVATGSVFGSPDLTRNTEAITLAGFSSQTSKAGGCALFGRNDLEHVVFASEPAVLETQRMLTEAVRLTLRLTPALTLRATPQAAPQSSVPTQAGADAGSVADGAIRDTPQWPRVRMTGSGACVFAVADNELEAGRIAEAFGQLAARQRKRVNDVVSSSEDEASLRKASHRVFVVAGLQEHPFRERTAGE